MYIDAVQKSAGCRAGPATGEKVYAMTLCSDTTEDFVQMDFCAAAVWIFPVVPVDDEDAH
jgi:hypothetical protein